MDTVGVDQVMTEIKGYSHTGEGVGDYRGKPVFIPLAARGEAVRFSISEEKKNYARGCLVEVVRPAPWRTGAPCTDYRHCGGCQLQHLTYDEQLYFKRQTIIAALQRIGGLEKVPVQDVLPMDNPWHYRHTVRLHAQRGPQGTVLGNYLPKSHSVCPLTTCSLLPVEFPAILADLSKIIGQRQEVMYSAFFRPGRRPGCGGDQKRDTSRCSPGEIESAFALKDLVIRKGRATEEILLLLLTEGSNHNITKVVWSELRTLHPNLVGIVSQSNGATAGHRDTTVIGQNFYSEIIAGIRFHIPATAFFQNNPKQAEVLLQQARALCEPSSSEHLLDLYCGVGFFTHYLAHDYDLVTGIEENSIAVAAAGENAEINNNSNTVFISGRVEKTLARIAKSVPAPDTIILDPPRQGCLPGAIAGIAALSPKRIVYVSCNPATMARDLALLVKQSYHVQVVQPIDMFPHTYHIECVAKIERQ